MEEDAISRKRLTKKVLDRWENEGGKLCEDPTKTPDARLPHRRKRNVVSLSPETSPAENETSSARKLKSVKK